MEDSFQVIENYLMVRMPEEIDHHKSVYISKKADDYIMWSFILKIQNLWTAPVSESSLAGTRKSLILAERYS